MKSIFIGIAGGTGSGKSTFANRIKETFRDYVTVINYDNYYKCRDDISIEERKCINYDHPDALDTDLLIKHIKELKKGNSVTCPLYDFKVHNRSSDTMRIEVCPIIIIEGILLLQNSELRDMLDIKIYVEADADERILRRTIRDVKERGRDLEGVMEQYLTSVKPMHYFYVEPTKAYADIIINSGMNDVAFDIMCAKINEILSGGN